MQNLKPTIVAALKASSTLRNYVSDRIYFYHPDNFNTLPAISYFEFNNIGNLFADDAEAGSEIIFQIDIWSNGSTSNIASAIDTIMVAQGFVRIESVDLFEKDTFIHHKSMKYRIDYLDPDF